jgi:hypothetical protein
MFKNCGNQIYGSLKRQRIELRDAQSGVMMLKRIPKETPRDN